MPISPQASYRLIYAQAPFAQYTEFLKGLQAKFPTLEVPFLEAMDLPEEARESVDQYLYVLNDERASSVVAAVKTAASRGRTFPARMEDLGVVPGRDVAAMLARFRQEQEGTAEIGLWYRIQSGLYRTLIVRMTDRDPAEIEAHACPPVPGRTETSAKVVVEYFQFGRAHSLVVPQSNLTPTRAPVPAASTFTNYLASARRKKAVILDADTELREACCRVHNLYTRPDPREVQAALDAGREPPRWGRYVGGAQGMYFTISRFRMLYPEYELHVVFDERPEGPQAGQGSPSFQAAFAQNRDWVKRYVRESGFFAYEIPGARSEDVIGSLLKRMTAELGYWEVVIATKGTDLYPLVSDRVRLNLPKVNFRDHPQTIRVEDAVAKFELANGSQLERIYWLRAITGDVGGTPSVNLFNKNAGHRYTNIRREDYLPHVLAASNLSDLKLRLLAFEQFHPFIHCGQFDRNLSSITLDDTLLDHAPSLSAFRQEDEDGQGRVNVDAIRRLLEANEFHKECEYLDWQVRVTRGLW